jgi:zinc finger FYVE domain-containing protein 26
MLSEIYPGGSPKMGSTYWDQILEVGVISVSRRVLKRLLEFLEQVQYYVCMFFVF